MAVFNGTRDSNVGLTIDNNSRLSLTLDTRNQFDDPPVNFDNPSGDFDLGGTDSSSNPNFFASNVQPSGIYDFDNTLTLDDTYDTTLVTTVGMSVEDEYDKFDDGRGASKFEDAKGPFDGSPEVQAGAEIQVGTSNTSLGAISNYQKVAQQSTLKGKYFKFRAKLTSINNKSKPKIHALSFSVALEKRTETAEDKVSGTGVYSVTFANAFYAVPSIGISAQGLSTGDYYSITSKSKTGFSIQFKNSGGSGISKTFDWQATGYGLKS